jgi:hypothetical protein
MYTGITSGNPYRDMESSVVGGLGLICGNLSASAFEEGKFRIKPPGDFKH